MKGMLPVRPPDAVGRVGASRRAGLTLDHRHFDRNVAASDGTRAAVKAPHATLRGRDETAVFSGEPGVRPTIATSTARSGRGRSGGPPEERVDAGGRRETTYLSGAGDRHVGLLGSAQSAPFFSESDTLTSRAAPRRSSLTAPSARGRTRRPALRDARARRQGKDAAAPKTSGPSPGETPPRSEGGKAQAPAGPRPVTRERRPDAPESTVRRLESCGRSVGPLDDERRTYRHPLTETRAIGVRRARGAVVVEDPARSTAAAKGRRRSGVPWTGAVTLEGSRDRALTAGAHDRSRAHVPAGRSAGGRRDRQQGSDRDRPASGGFVSARRRSWKDGLAGLYRAARRHDVSHPGRGRRGRRSPRGRTAAGKTTTFSMAVGLVMPDAGLLLPNART